MDEAIRYVEENGLTQVQAAEAFGTTQPRISHLVNGKINELTTDTLVRWLATSGHEVCVSVTRAA